MKSILWYDYMIIYSVHTAHFYKKQKCKNVGIIAYRLSMAYNIMYDKTDYKQ